MEPGIQDMLDIAFDAAVQAGEIQREYYEKKNLDIELKGRIDLVTEVDLLCEKAVTATISESFPDHGILAEEGTSINGGSPYQWIIDPLDGTTNFAHGFPMFAVSIGLVKDGEILLGVIYDPLRDELFSAKKDGGATMNGHSIKVSETSQLDKSLVATGFPYDVKTSSRNNLNNFNRVIMEVRALRRPGAAAIDLAYVACGRLDGFWEQRLKPWDMAAGALIVSEAGGIVTDMKGKPLDLFGETCCAGNPQIHRQLLDLLED